MDEDERSAVADRERVAPEPEREPERHRRRGDRIQRLPGYVRPDPGDAHGERVERLVEPHCTKLDRTEERLGVRDRGRSGEGGGRCDRPRLITENGPANTAREKRVQAPERRARDVAERGGLVRVVPEPARETGVVEHERDARQRDLRGDGALDGERELPCRLSRCLQRASSPPRRVERWRRRTRRAAHRGRRAGSSRPLTRRRRGPSRRARDGCAHRCPSESRDRDEIFCRRVVDERRGRGTRVPPEAAAAARGRAGRASGRGHPRRGCVWRSSATPSAVSSASTVASASCRGSICAPGIGSAGGSTTTVTRASRRARLDEGRAAEWEAKRVPNGSGDVDGVTRAAEGRGRRRRRRSARGRSASPRAEEHGAFLESTIHPRDVSQCAAA